LNRFFQNIGIKAVFEDTQVSYLDPGCSAAIKDQGKQIGVLGRIDQKVLDNWGIKHQDVYYARYLWMIFCPVLRDPLITRLFQNFQRFQGTFHWLLKRGRLQNH